MQTERGWKGGGEYAPPPYAVCSVRAPAQCYQLVAQRRARVEKKPSRAKTNPTFRQGLLVLRVLFNKCWSTYMNSIDFDLQKLTIINICRMIEN